MNRALGSLTVHATCGRCETEVTFRYWWDRSVGGNGVEDTEHKAPDGSNCDLSELDIDNAIEGLTPDYREDDDE